MFRALMLFIRILKVWIDPEMISNSTFLLDKIIYSKRIHVNIHQTFEKCYIS